MAKLQSNSVEILRAYLADVIANDEREKTSDNPFESSYSWFYNEKVRYAHNITSFESLCEDWLRGVALDVEYWNEKIEVILNDMGIPFENPDEWWGILTKVLIDEWVELDLL